MKKLLIASLVAASFASPALSADMPVKAPPYISPTPVSNWTGFYLGIEGGGAWGRSTHDYLPLGTHGSFDLSGGLIGGTAGYNLQWGQFVVGLEGDVSWTSSRGSTIGSPGLCTNGPCTSALDSLSTIRGRIGYDAGSWLPYLTGGAAFGNLRACENLTCNSSIEAGWTIGVGVEKMFAPNWSGKLEYLYADFGRNSSYFFIVPHFVSLNASIFRAGVNYHFGGPIVAKY